jgi:hypothetical protein
MPWDQSNDFDLWRNMQREFAEEFLGDPEADGSGGEPIDYNGTDPFRSLNAARRVGKLIAHCFGIGLDPLTLAGEILAVVVGANPHDVAEGIPFTESNIRRLLDSEPLAPAAAACLDLAWEHRGIVLG